MGFFVGDKKKVDDEIERERVSIAAEQENIRRLDELKAAKRELWNMKHRHLVSGVNNVGQGFKRIGGDLGNVFAAIGKNYNQNQQAQQTVRTVRVVKVRKGKKGRKGKKQRTTRVVTVRQGNQGGIFPATNFNANMNDLLNLKF